MGRTIRRLRIVDEASGPWGHINVDDFRFGLARRPPDVFKSLGGERGDRLDQTPQARVPDLSGQTESQAREVLAKERLRVGDITKVEAEATPGIVEQDPRPVAESPSIHLWASHSRSPSWRLFRTCRGDGIAGRAVLAKARLGVGEITRVEADITPGTVLKQDRRPGSRVPIDTPVGFAVAIPIMATVPDLSGRTEAEARQVLAKARLQCGRDHEGRSRHPPGTVLKQDRRPGSPSPSRHAGRLRARDSDHGDGPGSVGTHGNRGTGASREGAPRCRRDHESRSQHQAGTVLKQDRRPGSRVPLNTAIGFALAIPIMTTVPDVSGSTEAEARQVLAKARLRAGDITKVEANIPPGTVLKQDRRPGSQLPIDTPVGFALAIPITVEVPDLSGAPKRKRVRCWRRYAWVSARSPRSKPTSSPTPCSSRIAGPAAGSRSTRPSGSRSRTDHGGGAGSVRTHEPEARELSTRVRLRSGDVGSKEDRRPPGTVISQKPAANTRVVIGTSVGIVTARRVTASYLMLSHSEAEAREMLKNVELTVGTVSAEESRRPARFRNAPECGDGDAGGDRFIRGSGDSQAGDGTRSWVGRPERGKRAPAAHGRRNRDWDDSLPGIGSRPGNVLAQSINPDSRCHSERW